jgi:hypothetical protein
MLPLNPPLTRGASPTFVSPERRLDEHELEAFDSDPNNRKAQLYFARHLLERDPENIWAMMVVARHSETGVEYLALLREAVRVGLRLWAPELTQNAPKRDWGSDRDAAPFLAAVITYGMALMEEGHRDEAAQCLRFLLRLDPEDRIGAVASMEEVGLVRPGNVSEEDGPSPL